jgi:hypothetical protein
MMRNRAALNCIPLSIPSRDDELGLGEAHPVRGRLGDAEAQRVLAAERAAHHVPFPHVVGAAAPRPQKEPGGHAVLHGVTCPPP